MNDEQWDDNLIIEAYERSMKMVNKQVNDLIKINSISSNQNTHLHANKEKIIQWKIGDYCQAIYSEDNQWYEAEIISIDQKECKVRFFGYLNEETLPLDQLKKSAGQKNRLRQETQCREEMIDNLLVDDNVLDDNHDNVLDDNDILNDNHKNNVHNPTILMPPTPNCLPKSSKSLNEDQLLSTTLMSWYMSGYHTGYYQAIKDLKKSK